MSSNPVLNLFLYLWRYSKGNHGKVVLFLIMETIAVLAILGNALVISRAFNDVQFSSSDPRLLEYFIFNLCLLIGINLIYYFFHITSRVLEMENAFTVRKNYKEDMVGKLLDLPLDWHKQHHSGDTIDKINKSSNALFTFSSKTFQLNASLVRITGSLLAIFLFDKLAALIALVVTVVAVTSMLKFDLVLRKTYFEINKLENFLASAIHDYITNIFSIITLRLKDRVNKEVELRSGMPLSIFKKNIRVNEGKWFTIGFLTTVMTVVVLSLNAYHSFHTTGYIIIGTMFALYTYLHNIGNVFSNFASLYGEVVQNDTAVRSANVINEEYEKISHQKNLPLPSGWKELIIKDLSFTYSGTEEKKEETKHLENINLVIRNKQKIALIGESGSGKSTILALLRGLYMPDHVEVYIDGEKLGRDLGGLYDLVTLIPQEPELFNSTVLDNITMETKVGDEELQKAIDLAQFRSVLNRLPNGLKTHVMEKGISLSGGEKQRLALARGILAALQSDFVFLDEPTSSVDFTNEMKIYENILEAFKDKTLISTVHNLSLLKYFDYIYFFGNGKLITGGSFEEIMNNKDFKTLWGNYSKNTSGESKNVV